MSKRIQYRFQKPKDGWVQWVTRSIPLPARPAPGYKAFPNYTSWYKLWLWRFGTEFWYPGSMWEHQDYIVHRGWKHTVYILTSVPTGVVEAHRSVSDNGHRIQVKARLCQ